VGRLRGDGKERSRRRADTVVSHFAAKYKRKKAAPACVAPNVEVFVTDYVIVLTTIGADVDAAGIGMRLVEERLAACVNALPEMESFFRWHGAVERDRERQLLIKTTAERLPDLERRLHEMHPYDLPEFLVLRVAQGSAEYLKWVTSSTT
jgi:periplasmic divalent cation tolerance protein